MGISKKISPRKADHWVHSLYGGAQSSVKLICFPFAGGGLAIYRSWACQFAANIEVSGVLLPGREIRIRQTPEPEINKVCHAIVEELIEKYKGKSLVFFGHSMGALLAYEVAKRLQQYHQWPIKALLISGRQAPHLRFGGDFHQASETVFIQEIRRLGRTPEAIFEDEDIRNLVLRNLRADYSLLENYRLSDNTPLNCPLLTFTGRHDTEVTPQQIQRWSDLVQGEVCHQVYEGEHFYLLEGENSKKMSDFIGAYLQKRLDPAGCRLTTTRA